MKQHKELLVLVVLLVIAGNIWYWFFFRQKPLAPSGTVAVAQSTRLLSVENPAPHTDRREAAVQGMNAHIAFVNEAGPLLARTTAQTTDALTTFRIP